MPDLTKEMTITEINKLDNFEKAQLYHNVYYNKPYLDIPQPLRIFYQNDEGLILIKATISNANIKDPYEVAKLIKALNPAKPQTLQEIYSRASYLADIFNTSIEKILKSDIFNVKDYIPQLNENAIKTTLSSKTTGMPITLQIDDYTPAPDDSGSITPTPTPTPTPIEGDYADERKIYFTKNNNTITCETSFADVISEVPKLPAAELLLGTGADSQNILNISCSYNELRNVADFNFIRIYDNMIEFLTVYYSPSSITYETNNIIIENNTI